MDIIKLVGVGIIGTIIAVSFKNWKSEYTIYIILATGVAILIYTLYYLKNFLTAFYEIIDKTNLDSKLYNGILKIIGIGYLTEYASSICKDAGASSISETLQLCGKITIFLLSLPIITSLIDVLVGFSV